MHKHGIINKLLKSLFLLFWSLKMPANVKILNILGTKIVYIF